MACAIRCSRNQAARETRDSVDARRRWIRSWPKALLSRRGIVFPVWTRFRRSRRPCSRLAFRRVSPAGAAHLSEAKSTKAEAENSAAASCEKGNQGNRHNSAAPHAALNAGGAGVILMIASRYSCVRSADDGSTAAPHPVKAATAPSSSLPLRSRSPRIQFGPAHRGAPAMTALRWRGAARKTSPLQHRHPNRWRFLGRRSSIPLHRARLSGGWEKRPVVDHTLRTYRFASRKAHCGGEQERIYERDAVGRYRIWGQIVGGCASGARQRAGGREQFSSRGRDHARRKVTGRVTPAQFAVEKGAHTVSLKKLGYLDETTMADLAPGQNFQYAPALKALGNAQEIRTVGKFKKLLGRVGRARPVWVRSTSIPGPRVRRWRSTSGCSTKCRRWKCSRARKLHRGHHADWI